MRLQLLLKSLFTLLLFADNLFAQPTFKSKDNRLESFEAVKELRYGGILIVRLKTNYVKIKALEKELSNQGLKASKRKRTQAILDETMSKKDALNQTLSETFLDSFSFCPVYLSFDSSANSLKNGLKKVFF